jgi:hypothetical protein
MNAFSFGWRVSILPTKIKPLNKNLLLFAIDYARIRKCALSGASVRFLRF